MNHAFCSEDLLRMQWTGNPVLSPDGTKLLYEVTQVLEDENTYVTNIWLWDGESSFPCTTNSGQLTINNKHPLWSPDGNKIAFLSDRSGKNQIWLLSLTQGEAQQLTHEPKGVSDFRWAPNHDVLYYVAKEDQEPESFRKHAKVTHISKLRYKFNGQGLLDHIPAQLFQLDLSDKKSTQLTTGPYNCTTPVISPCNKYLVFSGNRSEDEQDLTTDLWLLEIESKKITRLTPHNGRYADPVWLSDGSLLCKGIDKHPYPGGSHHIWKIDVQHQTMQKISEQYPYYIGKSVGNDVSSERGKNGLTVSACEKYVYFITTQGGNCYLERLEIATGQAERVFGDGQMVITSYDVKNNYYAFNIADPTTPCDIWYGKTTDEVERLTYLNAALFQEKYIAWPEVVHFESPEGVTLEGWLLKPMGFEEGQKYPIIMEIHGGPHTTYGNIFFHEFQILTGNGYGVFYGNPRGSLGYGDDFARAVVGDWCGCDARDLEFMARQVREIDWVDETHLGVTGGSQGGYFTNWLISHCNIFSAAVTQRSMSNLYTKYGIADNGWNGDRFGMGGADLWENEDFVLERSPIRYAPHVNTPLLLIHSDQDFRCPLEQAEQWYVALKRLGNITEMMLFHGENHNLSRTGKPANRLVRLDSILNWFNKYC